MFVSFVIGRQVRPPRSKVEVEYPADPAETEQSRQFGFLRFATLQEAEDFMDRNYPTLYLYGDSNKHNEDASKVRIAYGRERKDQIRGDDVDWICGNVCKMLSIFIASRS